MTADSDLLVVATFRNAIEADLARTALEAAGILAVVPETTTWTRNVQQFCELKVQRKDVARATEILRVHR